jgi:hypothetical protein
LMPPRATTRRPPTGSFGGESTTRGYRSAVVEALDAGQVTTLGIGIIAALIIVGLIISLIVSAIVVRIVIAIAVVVLAFVVWQQRNEIQHKIAQHHCGFSFFGVHLDPPDHLKRLCD